MNTKELLKHYQKKDFTIDTSQDNMKQLLNNVNGWIDTISTNGTTNNTPLTITTTTNTGWYDVHGQQIQPNVNTPNTSTYAPMLTIDDIKKLIKDELEPLHMLMIYFYKDLMDIKDLLQKLEEKIMKEEG